MVYDDAQTGGVVSFKDKMEVERQIREKLARDRRKKCDTVLINADQIGQLFEGDEIYLMNKDLTGWAKFYEKIRVLALLESIQAHCQTITKPNLEHLSKASGLDCWQT